MLLTAAGTCITGSGTPDVLAISLALRNPSAVASSDHSVPYPTSAMHASILLATSPGLYALAAPIMAAYCQSGSRAGFCVRTLSYSKSKSLIGAVCHAHQDGRVRIKPPAFGAQP